MGGNGTVEALARKDVVGFGFGNILRGRDGLGGGVPGDGAVSRYTGNEQFRAHQILSPFSGSLGHASSVRHASTTPKLPTEPSTLTIEEPTAATADRSFADASEIIAAATQPQVEPYIGFLKDLGLDFGWGPTAILEWSLEHVHVYLGTPWWATLAITTLAIRLVLFRTYIGSSDNSARLQTIQPHIKDLQDRINKAKQERDMNGMMQGTQEMRLVYTAGGIKLWRNILPLISVPLGYGMFRLTRNMAWLPVPGLDEGGTLWFCDLTVADPTYLLPLITGVSTFYMFKFGAETGVNPTIPQGVMMAFQWGFPVLSTVIMCFWPAAMQLGFAWTAILSFAQSWAFRQPGVRSFLGIHPMPDAASVKPLHQTKGMVIPTTATTRSDEPETPAQGLMGSARSKFKQFVDRYQKSPTTGRSKGQVAEAQRYEERRRRETERERYEARREKQRRKEERRTREL
ncbi:MAG: hypothetical protein Q9219_005760 [cf. Caloplaca sp. 3 TL-2023]